MTIAAGIEQSRSYGLRSRAGTLWRRLVVMLALVTGDLLSFAAADVLIHLCTIPPALALFRGQPGSHPDTVIDLLGLIAPSFVVMRYVVGDYSRRQLFWDGARATTGSLLIWGTIYLGAVLILMPGALLPAMAVWIGLLFLLPSLRHGMRHLLSLAGFWKLPTAIMGTSQTAQEIRPVLARQLSLGYDLRWIIPENPERYIPGGLQSLAPVLAPSESVVEALSAIGCRQVILVADDDPMPAGRSEMVDEMIGSGIGVAIVPSLRRLPLFSFNASYFFGKDLLLLQIRNNLGRMPQRIFKRVLDVIGAVAALVALAPLFAILAILIRREDGGPVFFVQNRVGRDGRDFRCWKFRTMCVDAESQMDRWAKENPLLLARYRESNFKLQKDPRVTKIGAWLRSKSLDELPQLINVLLGEMSLVGPRPLLRRELPDYGGAIALYRRVRPGITGLWQTSGRSHTTFAERVSYDEWYIKNWTVWYDVVIMLQTVWVLWRGEGAF